MESRTVFDGALAATVADAAKHQADAHPLDAGHARAADAHQSLSAALRDSTPAQATVKSVVFIDSGVSNAATLIKDIPPSATIVMLQSGKDGVDQIAQYLAAHAGYGAVHILSHGSEANLYLGTADLNSASMATTYAADLATIKAALAPNADILVYGCDFAKGADGNSAAHELSALTGANVAASIDITGAAALGGNWVLEDTIGTVHTSVIIDDATRQAWNHDLGLTTSTYTWPAAGTVVVGTPKQLTVAGKAGAITLLTTGTGSDSYNVGSGGFSGGTGQNSLLLSGGTSSTTAGQTASLTFNSVLYPQGVKTASFDIFNIDAQSGSWCDQVIVTAYDTKGNLIPGSAITVTPLATPTEYSITKNAGNVDLIGTSTDSNSTYDVPADTPNISITSSTGFNVGKVSIQYVSGKAGTSTGLIGIGTLTTTYDPSSVYVSAALPNTTYVDGQSGISINASTGFTDALGQAMTYSVSGLPAGLTLNTATGVISGTIDHDASLNAPSKTGAGATLDGKYTVSVTAVDAKGGSATTTFTIDSTNQAPTLGTATTNQSSNLGQTVAAVKAASAFTDPNTGDVITYIASGLPTGLTIDPKTGAITGTVNAADALGAYTVKVTATDDKGASATETFTWTVNDPAPTANADSFTTVHDTPVTLNVLSNDTDMLGRSLTINQVNGTAITAGGASVAVTGGAVALNSSGQLIFTPTAGTIGTPSFTYTIADPAGGTSTATVSGTITDAAPVVDLSNPSANYSTTFTEKSAAVTIANASATSITDADNANMASATITLTNAQASDLMSIRALPAGITGTVNTSVVGVITVTLTGSATKAAYATALDAITFSNSSLNPSTTARTITVTVSDGMLASNTAVSTITVVPVDNAPVESVPAAQTTNANTALTINGLSVSDVDANGTAETVTLSVGHGTLALATTAGLSGLSGTGTASSPLVFTGTLASLNAAIAGLKYTPTTNFIGADSLTFSTNDNSTLQGGPLSATQSVAITVKDVPPVTVGAIGSVTYADASTITPINTASGFTDAAGLPLTYALSGTTPLPLGLTLNAATGQITGTLNHDASKGGMSTGSNGLLDGKYTITVIASDQTGANVSQTFTIDSTNQAPTVGTVTANVTSNAGAAITGAALVNAASAFTDPNGDPLTYTASGLPAGLAISSAGSISGTIASTAVGTYSVKVTATDNKGASSSETFSWTVNDVPPAAAGTLPNQSVKDAQQGISIATASGFTNPLSLATMTYSAAGLPAGLTINAATGVITGTIGHDASKNAPVTSGSGATLDGTYTVKVTVSDGQGGTAVQTFTIDATNQAPTVGTTTAAQSNPAGSTVASVDASQAFSDPNTAPGTADTLTYAATGLPTGITINAATGVITGTIGSTVKPGSYSVTVTATDDKGAGTAETFSWAVTDVPPTAAGTLANTVYPDSTGGISLDTATGFTDSLGVPLTYSASGLPAGLGINPVTGAITGTLSHDASKNAPSTTGAGATLDGKYTVTVTANDGQGGTATQTFTIDATNQAPVVGTATASQTVNAGAAVTLDPTPAFSDPNTGDVLTYSASGLPPGLSINATTGKITGSVATTAPGTYTSTITATDDKGAAVAETVTWTVNNVPPTTNGTLPAQVFNDGQAGIAVATSGGFSDSLGLPLSYSVSGTTPLPAGLSINSTTGQITGTLSSDASKNAPSSTGSGATLDGKYTVTVIASDGQGGTAQQTFTIDARNQSPVLGTPTANQTATEGAKIAPINANAAFSDPNGDALSFAATGLPSGLSMSSSGQITGVMGAGTAASGPYTVTVTATDTKGASTSETFVFTVKPAGTIANLVLPDASTGVSIATKAAFNGTLLPTGFTATGLPAGLTINAVTGVISGTLDHDASKTAPAVTGSGATLDGKYTVTVTATDASNLSATRTFTIDATNQAPTVGTPTTGQSDAAGSTVTTVDASTAFSDPNTAPGTADTLTYSATGLPAGLAINASSGLITGTIATSAKPGAYSVLVVATDDKGASTSETFAWTVTDVAPQPAGTISPLATFDATTGIAITTATAFTNPLGLPASAFTYSASGLPAGLSINPATGAITGTIDHDASKNAPATTGSGATLQGTYTVGVTVNDGQGGTATQSFTITSSNQAPTVGTQTAPAAITAGTSITPVDVTAAFSDPNTAPGTADVLTYAASGLPPGLSINALTGKITGVVSATAPASGPYSVAVTATDDKGASATETFAWTVNDVPPVTSGTLAAQVVNDGQSLAIPTAGGFSDPLGLPLAYSAANLPKGLAIDPATGLISGTIDHDASKSGPYSVTITAADGQGGTVAQTFTITSQNQAPTLTAQTPTQTTADGAKVALNVASAFNDPNTGDVVTYTATGLPKGLVIDPGTGVISGTVDPSASKAGPYSVTVIATDDKGASTPETFSWNVTNVPPTSTALANQAVNDAQAVSIPVSGSFSDPLGLPLAYTALGLPKGLTIDPNTGAITGTIDHDASKAAPGGVYSVTVTGADGQGGTTAQTFTITSSNQAPTVAVVTPSQSSSDGASVTLSIAGAFTDPNTAAGNPANADTLKYSAVGLPLGLSINPVSGVITGTIDPSASKSGPYTVTVTATDDKGASTPETFAWSVSNVPPTVAAPIPNQTVNDSQAFALATGGAFSDPIGVPLTYSATGLPKGLAIDPTTGKITGTIDHDASAAIQNGVYTVTVTASDGQGGAVAQAFTITASNQAPQVTAQTPSQVNSDSDTVTLNAGSAFTDPNTGDVLTFSASGLPTGLVIDPKTGLISGTIDKSASVSGPFSVAVTATDDKGAVATEYFTWAVNNVPPGTVGPIPNQIVNDAQTFTLNTSSNFNDPLGLPLTYTATGLPKGLAIDTNGSVTGAAGTIYGTIDHDASKAVTGGVYSVTVTANDGQGGNAAETFTITSLNQAPTLAAQTPSQMSHDGDPVSLDLSAAFTDPNTAAGNPANADTLTYTASGLPVGLSISASGVITGTIGKSASVGGPYTVTVTATDDKGLATTETFTWTVADTPPVAVGTIQPATVHDGAAVSLPTSAKFNDPLGLPLTYTATNLPAGLAIDPTTGIISGTIDHNASQADPGGAYAIAVTASDGQGGTVTQPFTLTSVNDAPVVAATTPNQTSPDKGAVTLNVSAAFTDPNTAAGNPANADTLTYAAAGLPKGLSIDPATGIISGTVDKSASVQGTYSVTVTASDGKGGVTPETFTWTVTNVAPITTASGGTPALANVAAHDSQALVIATATGFTDPLGLPLTYSASGLPAGFAIDPTTGIITGTLNHDASKLAPAGYPISVTASDGQGGTVSAGFTLTSVNDAPIVAAATPGQISTDGASVVVSVAGAFNDPNSGDTLTYAATGLPKGLSITSAGVISGTIDKSASVGGPAGNGVYSITVTGTDDKGASTTETFAFSVNDQPPQATPALPAQSVYDAQSIAIDTTKGFQNPLGLLLKYTASGLPAGLAIDPATGQITGTIDHNASQAAPGGLYTVAVTVDDGQGGTATNTFTLTSANQAPTVTALTPNQSSVDGAAVSLNAAAAFKDPNTVAGNPANSDRLTYSAAGLPKGLTIDPATGIISGTIDKSASVQGTYSVTVTASDGKGGVTPETFNWTVANVPPVLTATPTDNATVNDGQTITPIAAAPAFADPLGLPLSYSATGLPKGLAIDPATGIISGTIDHDASINAPGGGAYSITVTVADGQGGTTAETFTITSVNQAPTVTAQTPAQTGSNGSAVTLNAAAAFSDPNTGDRVTYAASGLPKGLTVDPTSGVISGTIDPLASTGGTNGVYTLTVTATDDKGASTPETFTYRVNNLPLTASPIPNDAVFDSQKVTLAVDTSFSSPLNLPLTYSATGLPPGLSIDTTGAVTGKAGTIYGTIDHNASQGVDGGPAYSVTVTAADGQNTISKTFTITSTNQAPVVASLTPDQVSSNSAVVALDVTSAFKDPNAGDTLSYTASGLPKGLSISSTGQITGAIDKSASVGGPYTVQVTASDGKGGVTTETFTWSVSNNPPMIVAAIPNAIVNDGQGVSLAAGPGFNDPLGLPLTFTATGLPKGLVIDPKTGAISGTIDHDASAGGAGGVYTVKVSASDGQGGLVSQSFTIQSVNQAPALVAQTPAQASHDAAVVALDTSAAFKDPNTGDTVTYAASDLPKGLSINPATGIISGTIDPSASLGGPYTVHVTATDDKGASSTETFAWAVSNLPPVATLALPGQVVQDGLPVSVATASGFNDPIGVPLTYSATGLPAGLSINSTTGVISGTIDHDASKSVAGGVYSIVVTASDGQGGTAVNAFAMVSTNQPPVVAHQTPPQLTPIGTTVSLDASAAFTDPNTGDTPTYTATGLPKGLVIDPSTGVISGTVDPTAVKSLPYVVTVTSTDDKGAATPETFTWTVTDVPPTATGSLTPQTFPDSTAGIAIPTATGFISPYGLPLTYAATGLPVGFAINSTTGIISGTLDHDASKAAPATSGSGASLTGIYAVTVTASDGQGGAATQAFNLSATNQAPALGTATLNQVSLAGTPATLATATAFTDPNSGDVLTFAATGLPAGTTIDPKTGIISGTFAASAAKSPAYTVTVTATDDKGASTPETFTWTVNDVPPKPLGSIIAQILPDGTKGVSIATAGTFTSPLGLPLTYSATGLPAGLSIDPTSGVISGTLDHDASKGGLTTGLSGLLDGKYTVMVHMSDGQGGFATQTFSIDATNQAPAITAATKPQFTDAGGTVALPVASAFADPNSGDVVTYAVTGLPKGLAINPATGVISGTVDPTASVTNGGHYSVTVTATDDKGAAMPENFAWTVAGVPPRAVGSVAPQSFADGTSGVSIKTGATFVSPNTLPLTFAATGLPKGLSIDAATGAITGTIDHDASANAPVTSGAGATLDGTYTVTVTVSDGQGGTAAQVFTIDATNSAPVAGSPALNQNTNAGAPATLAAAGAFSDPNAGDTLTFAVHGLPAGLAIDPKSGVISGKVAATAPGVYTVTVIATDDKGASTPETFTWTVNDVPPKPVGNIPALILADGTKGVSIATAGNFISPLGLPLTYSATHLPAGLSIDPKTGAITGTPTSDAAGKGPYAVTVTVADGYGGTATQTFTIGTPQLAAARLVQMPAAPSAVAPPAARPAINVEGAVVDAVRESNAVARETASVSGQLTVQGPVEAAVNAIQTLNGSAATATALATSGSFLRTAIGLAGRTAPPDLLIGGPAGHPGDIAGLTGFSLRFGYDGQLDSASTNGQLIIETLVRERQLIVQLSNTYARVGRHVVEYRAMLADGRPLPEWLQGADGGLLIGEAPPSVPSVDIRVIAILDDGTAQERLITIQTTTGEIQPLAPGKRAELPMLLREKLGSHTTLAERDIAALARWLAA